MSRYIEIVRTVDKVEGTAVIRLDLDKVKEVVNRLEDLVGSEPVVKAIEVGGDVVRVELIGGRVIEVPKLHIPVFLFDVMLKTVRMISEKSREYLERMIQEVRREVGNEEVEISNVKVRIREVPAIIVSVLERL
jgi:hypothetical protein